MFVPCKIILREESFHTGKIFRPKEGSNRREDGAREGSDKSMNRIKKTPVGKRQKEVFCTLISANKLYRKLQRKLSFFTTLFFNIVNIHSFLNRTSVCGSKHWRRIILEKFLSKKEQDSWVWCFTPYNPRI